MKGINQSSQAIYSTMSQYSQFPALKHGSLSASYLSLAINLPPLQIKTSTQPDSITNPTYHHQRILEILIPVQRK